ncbi:MAG: hypothetical protein Q8929_00185 [Bacillota bacterium]|nr:hypothetical protein [Bacillota bacterium]
MFIRKNFNTNRMFIFFIFLVCSMCFISSPLFANSGKKEPPKTGNSDKKEPPKTGNFAVSNTPSSLLSFGQHIVSENHGIVYLFADYFAGKKRHNTDLIPSLLYGVTDDFSIFFNVPIAANFKYDNHHSSGLEDMFLQMEYAFYSDKTRHYTELATLVANVAFPTGSTKKNPTTGFGSSSFLLGGTYSRTYTDWYGFTCPGVILTTSHHETKFGNQFLYQFGLGRNIFSIDSEWTVALLVEANGNYTQKNKINGTTDPNSGGNVVNVTPSLWISSNDLIIQLGIGAPAIQHLFGHQNKNKYLLTANIGWSF